MGDDRLPGSQREIQPTVLVSGRARELRRRVPLLLLAERAEPGDGAVVVTTREDPAVVARRLCGAVAAFDSELVAMVDATNKSGTTLTRPADLRWHVPSPVSLDRAGTAVDAALDELRARDVGRIHFLFESLTVPFRLVDTDAVHRYVHDLAMAVGGERGLGLFTLAPSVAAPEEYEGVRHLVDVQVAVRRTADGPQVRWTGLVGRSDDWVPLVDVGFRFDALGNRLG